MEFNNKKIYIYIYIIKIDIKIIEREIYNNIDDYDEIGKRV